VTRGLKGKPAVFAETYAPSDFCAQFIGIAQHTAHKECFSKGVIPGVAFIV